jgi:hypothetical protein
MGSAWRGARLSARAYAPRPGGSYAPAIASEYATDNASMNQGGAPAPASLARIRYPDWGSYPDASHRQRSYGTRPAVAHMGAVYSINPDGSVSDTPMTGAQVAQAYGDDPIWGEQGDWSGTTLASNIVSGVQAEIQAVEDALEGLGVDVGQFEGLLAEATIAAAVVLGGVVLVEVLPLLIVKAL